MDISLIHKFLEPRLSEVAALIVSSLRSDVSLLDRTNMSVFSNPGKLLRPMLTLCAAGISGGVNDDSVHYAAATELLHNATLLHDDVVDGSDLRRGKPTVSSLLGSTAAVLLGDFWLVKALDVILGASHYSEPVVRLFGRTISQLAEGEIFQMEKSGAGDTSMDDYLRIVHSKTASLFETAVICGAISADAPERVKAALKAYAGHMGVAFQMKDDVLDYTGGEATGKPRGQDLKERKITLPLLCAFRNVSPEDEASVRDELTHDEDAGSMAARVRDFVLGHEGIEGAETIIAEEIALATECISTLPASDWKDRLSALAGFVGERAE